MLFIELMNYFVTVTPPVRFKFMLLQISVMEDHTYGQRVGKATYLVFYNQDIVHQQHQQHVNVKERLFSNNTAHWAHTYT